MLQICAPVRERQRLLLFRPPQNALYSCTAYTNPDTSGPVYRSMMISVFLSLRSFFIIPLKSSLIALQLAFFSAFEKIIQRIRIGNLGALCVVSLFPYSAKTACSFVMRLPDHFPCSTEVLFAKAFLLPQTKPRNAKPKGNN